MKLDELKKTGFSNILRIGCSRFASAFDSEHIEYYYYALRYGRYLRDIKYMDKFKKIHKEKFSEYIDSKRIPVFCCWFQGFGNAPEVVKVCNKRLKSKLDNKRFQLVEIDFNNYLEFVKFPEYIQKKIEKNIIPLTQLSDLLRTYLIVNYGGVWIDSTMLLYGDIPDEVLKNEIFVFKFRHYFLKHVQVASNQFLYSREKNNEIFTRTLYGMYVYWKKNNKLGNYYFYHYFFSLAVTANEHTYEEFKKIPFYNSLNNHLLQYEMYDKYDARRVEYIMSQSFIHKLTYKIDDSKLKVDCIYFHILRNMN